MSGWTWPGVLARRLERQALSAPLPDGRPADIAVLLGGVHAQVLSAAEVSIGVRLFGVTRADVQAALWEERSLVKTRGPRGTVHLLAATDLPMWTGALSAMPAPPYVQGSNALMSEAQVDEVVAAIADALRDAELTADELTEAIVARTGPWAGDLVMEAFQGKWPRWMQAMEAATKRGAMCFGPNRGRRVTYTSPVRWLPGFQRADGPTALAEVARRYLFVYGPATPAQFAQWLAVPRRWAADLFDSLDGSLERIEIDGGTAWVVAGDAAPPTGVPAGLRLLPYFDAYPVGCYPRELIFSGRAAERIPSVAVGNFPVLLIDGVVNGVWHQRRSGKRLDVTVEPLSPLTSRQRRELDEQAARIANIQEASPRLTIGTVTVGPHA